MYCKFCGTEMNDEAVFCPKCGKRQDGSGSAKKLIIPLLCIGGTALLTTAV